MTPMMLDVIYGHLLSHDHCLFHNAATLDVASADANFVAKNRPNRGCGGCHSSNFTAGRGGRYYQENRPPYQFGNQQGRGRGG